MDQAPPAGLDNPPEQRPRSPARRTALRTVYALACAWNTTAGMTIEHCFSAPSSTKVGNVVRCRTSEPTATGRDLQFPFAILVSALPSVCQPTCRGGHGIAQGGGFDGLLVQKHHS